MVLPLTHMIVLSEIQEVMEVLKSSVYPVRQTHFISNRQYFPTHFQIATVRKIPLGVTSNFYALLDNFTVISVAYV